MVNMKGASDQALRSEVARLLREQRESVGLTQAELAARLNAQQSFVSKYEAGERRLDLVELREICSAMGIAFTSAIAELERRWGAQV